MGKRENRRTRGPLPGGIDPSAFVSSDSDRKAERKTRQLCREVRDTLSLALSTLDDDALVGAWIADVLPGADASQLRVVVVAAIQADVDATYEALRRAAGLLRSEIALTINRKRTPQLSFEVHKELGP
jgi:ribosome-binding factor A